MDFVLLFIEIEDDNEIEGNSVFIVVWGMGRLCRKIFMIFLQI